MLPHAWAVSDVALGCAVAVALGDAVVPTMWERMLAQMLRLWVLVWFCLSRCIVCYWNMQCCIAIDAIYTYLGGSCHWCNAYAATCILYNIDAIYIYILAGSCHWCGVRKVKMSEIWRAVCSTNSTHNRSIYIYIYCIYTRMFTFRYALTLLRFWW